MGSARGSSCGHATRPGALARRTVAVVVAAAALAGACGDDRRGGPRGSPEALVRSAADRTFAARAARVEAAAPDAQSSALVRFAAPPAAPLTPSGRGAATGYPELARPLALVDLLRGAVGVESYGGVAVRGVSTFRYETVLDVERALATTPPVRRAEVAALAAALATPAFYADVWLDADGRVRRVQVPLRKTTMRPAARDRRIPQFVTVDLYDYEA